MSDRRRLNGPPGGTQAPIFDKHRSQTSKALTRTRRPNEPRKIFLQTGLIPAANGSSYLELERLNDSQHKDLTTRPSLKLVCSVHGPRPVSRTSSFSPNLELNASVKFAAFASRQRFGYVRDPSERDLSTHLENALKGVIIFNRWPKSCVDIAITILEGEEVYSTSAGYGTKSMIGGLAMLTVLSGCITAATAALADARIDCLDLLAGGVAAAVPVGESGINLVLDPNPAEHEEVLAGCAVGYLPSRDELTEVWMKGMAACENGAGKIDFDKLIDSAIMAAKSTHSVLKEVLLEIS